MKANPELTEYADDPEAVRELTGSLRYCNADRRHSSLGYVSLEEFER